MGKGVVIYVWYFYVIISVWEVKIYSGKVAESVSKVIFCQNKVCINLYSCTIFQENKHKLVPKNYGN